MRLNLKKDLEKEQQQSNELRVQIDSSKNTISSLQRDIKQLQDNNNEHKVSLTVSLSHSLCLDFVEIRSVLETRSQEVIRTSYLNHGVLVVFVVIFLLSVSQKYGTACHALSVNFSTLSSKGRTIQNVDFSRFMKCG